MMSIATKKRGVIEMKKILAVLLTAALLFATLTVTGFSEKQKINYEIENPYADVDWDAWQGYKTQFHCHTTASDGYQPIREAIADYYALDYDAVAITDHGTTNRGWDKVPQTIPLVR
jgi:aspartate/methionine/tyrosine aminotransferase